MMLDDLPYIKNEKGEFAIPCQVNIAEDCTPLSEYCESKKEARDWVEEECWIFTGEGYFCAECNEQIMRNIARMQTKKMN